MENTEKVIKELINMSVGETTPFDSALHFRKTQPFQPELDNYLYFPNALSKEDIQTIHQLAEKVTPEVGVVNGATVEKSIRRSTVKWLSRHNPEHKWLYEKIANIISRANSQFWNFDLSAFTEDLQYTTYDGSGNDNYEAHMDFGKSAPFRKISITIQLSDPNEYDGGDLQFLITKDYINATREQGSAIVFPSYMIHRVVPVTRGIRQSLVLWCSGPPLR